MVDCQYVVPLPPDRPIVKWPQEDIRELGTWLLHRLLKRRDYDETAWFLYEFAITEERTAKIWLQCGNSVDLTKGLSDEFMKEFVNEMTIRMMDPNRESIITPLPRSSPASPLGMYCSRCRKMACKRLQDYTKIMEGMTESKVEQLCEFLGYPVVLRSYPTRQDREPYVPPEPAVVPILWLVFRKRYTYCRETKKHPFRMAVERAVVICPQH